MLNPEVFLIEQSAANRCSVWMCVWLGECKTTVKSWVIKTRKELYKYKSIYHTHSHTHSHSHTHTHTHSHTQSSVSSVFSKSDLCRLSSGSFDFVTTWRRQRRRKRRRKKRARGGGGENQGRRRWRRTAERRSSWRRTSAHWQTEVISRRYNQLHLLLIYN